MEPYDHRIKVWAKGSMPRGYCSCGWEVSLTTVAELVSAIQAHRESTDDVD